MTRNLETLPQLATKIHALEKTTVKSTIEIGRLLQVAFDQCQHGEFEPWLEKEFAWSERTALRYRNLYEFQNGHSVHFDKLNISLSALYALITFTDDDEYPDDWIKSAIDAVIREAKKKTRITKSMVQEILAGHIAKLETEQAKADAAAAPPVDDDDEAEPNELSKALQVILDQGVGYEAEDDWQMAARIISRLEMNIVIDRLRSVVAKYYDGGAMKAAADRAEAASRKPKAVDEPTPAATILKFPTTPAEPEERV